MDKDPTQIRLRFDSDSIEIRFRSDSDPIQIRLKSDSDSIQNRLRFDSDPTQIRPRIPQIPWRIENLHHSHAKPSKLNEHVHHSRTESKTMAAESPDGPQSLEMGMCTTPLQNARCSIKCAPLQHKTPRTHRPIQRHKPLEME